MSGLFDIYQSNVKILFQKISNNLDTISSETGEKIDLIESDLKEVQKLLKNLEIEVAAESPVSDTYLIVKNYKNGYNQYSKRFRKEKEKYQNSIKSVSLDINSKDSIKNNIKNDEIAYNSFDKLQNARRVTIEMQGIGQDVMRDMNGQSETMKNINSKIGNVSDDLSSSTSLISEMQKIRRRNKIIIYLYGGFLIILFLIIAFFRIYPKFKSDNPNQNPEPINTNNTNISSSINHLNLDSIYK
jgi:hypothetical protein